MTGLAMWRRGVAVVRYANNAGARGRNGLAGCRRGAVALEFALASTALLFIVFGFIATSFAFGKWSTMQSNVQYAARLMSTGQISRNNSGSITTSNTSSSTTCSGTLASNQVEYYACLGLPAGSTYTVTTAENCTVPSVTVTLSGSVSVADVMNIFSGKLISVQAVAMKEGTCP